MPGILPMKVIRMGNSSQSRIAQACDRCRSKKIRCDGIRPCCTQCANVGFECKTSDKLSRRAFPRGYTESLEDRVRCLEAEVRELKSLLDEKDEKIDVLSRIHSFHSASHPNLPGRWSQSPSSATESSKSSSSDTDKVILVRALQRNPTPENPFAGPSSVRAFSATFTAKLLEHGRSPSTVSTDALTASPQPMAHPAGQPQKTPPRLVSDQLINIFFQEWAPLYPVVHRPTVLKAYDRFLADPAALQQSEPLVVAQLNLIFSIAALSAKSRTHQDPTVFEKNWFPVLESLCGDLSMPALQCLVLAQIYCLTNGDYKTLIRYRGQAVGVCQMLGLHQNQTPFALDPLTTETRKKVFWCQYVLDRFAAALTGLPMMLRENDISTEFPADVDDENVSETGFSPSLPGEHTRLSSALALFKATQILTKVLENMYPAPVQYEICVSRFRALADELDSWEKDLPQHLKLVFSQDKPSTNVTSSRSPLLSMVYYFIKALVHRPAACYGAPNVAGPSILALADSSKHIVQILQLLDERRLSLSLSINRTELVYLAGLGLLWQNVDLKRDGKLVKESQRLLSDVIEQLEAESSAAAAEFSMLSNPHGEGVSRSSSKSGSEASPKSRSTEMTAAQQKVKSRPSVDGDTRTPARKSESSGRRATIATASPVTHSHAVYQLPPADVDRRHSGDLSGDHNFNVFEIDLNAVREVPKPSVSPEDWEFILSNIDRGQGNIYDGIYGGQECIDGPSHFPSLVSPEARSAPAPGHPMTRPGVGGAAASPPHGQSPTAWSASSTDLTTHSYPDLVGPQSASSYSEPSLSGCGDDLPAPGIAIPALDDELGDLGFFDGWDPRLVA